MNIILYINGIPDTIVDTEFGVIDGMHAEFVMADIDRGPIEVTVTGPVLERDLTNVEAARAMLEEVNAELELGGIVLPGRAPAPALSASGEIMVY